LGMGSRMSKRPKVSLSSIVAETARQAGEASSEPSRMDHLALVDEGAPDAETLPRMAAAVQVEPFAPAPLAIIAAAEAAPMPVSAPAPLAVSAPVAEPSAPRAPSGAATVGLPAILDLKAAGKLRDELCAAKGGPLEVDASKVQRLGGLCLQVLLSAQRTWAVDGESFRVVEPSVDFLDGVKAFGASALAETAPAAM
jgi:chemotaxis protein CheX